MEIDDLSFGDITGLVAAIEAAAGGLAGRTEDQLGDITAACLDVAARASLVACGLPPSGRIVGPMVIAASNAMCAAGVRAGLRETAPNN